MNYLIEFFEKVQINSTTVILFILVVGILIFLWKSYGKLKTFIIKNHEEEKAWKTKIEDTYNEVKQYKEHRIHDREQSLEIQKKLTKSLDELRDANKENTTHLKQLDERVLNYELADTRDKLMQNFRYFTSSYHNPMQAWTELEHEAFMEMLKVYEDRGGNGYMHTVVKPAMEGLRIIPMTQLEDIAELMHNRK